MVTQKDVKVYTNEYERNHNRKPRGRGKWAFDIGGFTYWAGRLDGEKVLLRGDTQRYKRIRMSGGISGIYYSDAKQLAIKQAVSQGRRQVIVLP